MFGLGIPALLVAAYVGYWFYLESQLRSFVLGWIEDQRAAGLQVSHGTIATGGFPFSVYADIPAPGITALAGEDMVSWQGESLRISFPPWDFLTYRFESPGEHLVAMVGAQSFAKWSLLAGTAAGSWAIRSGGAGALELELAQVEVVDALEQRFSLGGLAATVEFAAGDVPADVPRIAATAELTDVRMPEAIAAPFPPLVERLRTDARLQSPIVPSSLPLLWLVLRDYGGSIELAEVELGWGELAIETAGALQVDSGNYLTGRFPTRIAGYDDMIARLQQAGMIDALAATGLGALTGVMAGTGEDGRPTLALDIVLEDGLVKVQDITLFQMEPVPVAGAGS